MLIDDDVEYDEFEAKFKNNPGRNCASFHPVCENAVNDFVTVYAVLLGVVISVIPVHYYVASSSEQRDKITYFFLNSHLFYVMLYIKKE